MQDHLLGTLGWPFQAPNSAYGVSTIDIESDTLIPLHPIPSSDQVYEYLKRYCSQDSLLVVSPYTTYSHLLDLSRVGKPQQLMAKALTVMSSLRRDFAIAPFDEAFNWPTVINALKGLVKDEGFSWQRQEFHVIIFRSTLAPAADYLQLGEMDEKAHAEATKSGGLLKYWFGEPDVHGRNLATCKTTLAPANLPNLVANYVQAFGAALKIPKGAAREKRIGPR